MKKFVCLTLCLLMILGVAGCARQKPETALNNYFKNIRETVMMTLGMEIEDQETADIVEKMFEKFEYKIVNVEEHEDTADIIVQITNINSGKAVSDTLTEYFAFALTTIFNPLSDEEMEAKFYETLMRHLESAEMFTADITFHMIYVNDKWEIQMDEKMADTIIGGFTTYMDKTLFD